MGKRWALLREELVMDFTPQGTYTCLPGTSQADDSGATARMGSAIVAAVGTVLCRVDDYFHSQPRHLLAKIQPSLNW